MVDAFEHWLEEDRAKRRKALQAALVDFIVLVALSGLFLIFILPELTATAVPDQLRGGDEHRVATLEEFLRMYVFGFFSLLLPAFLGGLLLFSIRSSFHMAAFRRLVRERDDGDDERSPTLMGCATVVVAGVLGVSVLVASGSVCALTGGVCGFVVVFSLLVRDAGRAATRLAIVLTFVLCVFVPWMALGSVYTRASGVCGGALVLFCLASWPIYKRLISWSLRRGTRSLLRKEGVAEDRIDDLLSHVGDDAMRSYCGYKNLLSSGPRAGGWNILGWTQSLAPRSVEKVRELTSRYGQDWLLRLRCEMDWAELENLLDKGLAEPIENASDLTSIGFLRSSDRSRYRDLKPSETYYTPVYHERDDYMLEEGPYEYSIEPNDQAKIDKLHKEFEPARRALFSIRNRGSLLLED